MSVVDAPTRPLAASPYVLSLRQALKGGKGDAVADIKIGELGLEIRAMGDSLWALVRRPSSGGLAVRLAYLAGAFEWTLEQAEPGETLRIGIDSPLGCHCVILRSSRDEFERLRATVRFTPATPVLVPFMPRDLYPLDENDDPLGAEGVVEASQRGLNAGVQYLRIDRPAFGNVLYFQNLTALNDFYLATDTKPDGAVAGVWPELGYLVPSPPQSGTPPVNPLEAGVEVTLSDAILVFRHDAPPDERVSARQFLQMLGAAYKMLDLPPTDYRDWVGRATQTLKDLEKAPAATIRHYGHTYIHPYTAAEYPDIMVQMSVISALHDWGTWLGEPVPLEATLKAGLGKFHDKKLGTMRRYLPNVGKDKDADAVDSWYLYHPLLNLANLALDGDEDARTLLLDTTDFAIRTAHHFDYRWPVQFKVTDFSVITEAAGADGRGQTDVGGVYAWLMLQLFELTDDKRYIDEAEAALDAALGLRFNINYQANLTAWGAAACMRLWRIANRDVYLEQSYVYLASFFHNSVIWQSRLGHAASYETFMAVTCLQDAPYMAIYECFDSFLAFQRYLDDSGPDLDPAARMLVSEYCKYALSRAHFYYPDALPFKAIAEQQRESNGYIDHKLSFPVEDLYPDGQQAGQVGQEVYGAGAAFVFATRAFHRIEGAPFQLYCNHFVRAKERSGDRALSITLDGGETCIADLSFVRVKWHKLPKVMVVAVDGDVVRPRFVHAGRIDYHVPATGRVIINWE